MEDSFNQYMKKTKMSKLNQIKLPINLEELSEQLTLPAPNWKLVRERDGLTKQSEQVMWIEFAEDGFFKQRHEEPAVGRSLVMSPFNQFFTWQTTVVTAITEQRDGYLKFETKNSVYELTRI
jgi:hypothetical protein